MELAGRQAAYAELVERVHRVQGGPGAGGGESLLQEKDVEMEKSTTTRSRRARKPSGIARTRRSGRRLWRAERSRFSL